MATVAPDAPIDREVQRMKPLATLPVFFRLEGRRAVVAGGTDAAAWKAELLSASGATVDIYADEAASEMRRLIAAGPMRGAIVHHQRQWQPRDLAGAAVAICDADGDGEAAAFQAAAKRAGVPCNVIDKPAHCDFQFGSIVNRSPAVIAISTDGVAPILGQAIRRRIETLLPPALAAWAELGGRLRATVDATLVPGPQRRAFWEHFVDRAFGPPPQATSSGDLVAHIESISRDADIRRGRVTLVGAGPGDAELLTLKAVRALQAADVILFDDLVSDEVLDLARREARRMLVGKRGGRKSCRQEDINDMMVALAKAGRSVVRLKGGDPMIFGRAGEEMERLRAEGIAVTAIPGVTSALAMASSLGVSLTHRDLARSVRFVTGHSRDGGLPADIDWKALADPATTTIFYMGGRTAAAIVERLVEKGLSPTTPTVAVCAVSRPRERRWAGPLRHLAEGVTRIGADQPVLLGIGKAFRGMSNVMDRSGAPVPCGGIPEAAGTIQKEKRAAGRRPA